MRDRPAVKSRKPGRVAYSAARIGARVAALGREITREYKGRRVDVVVTLDRGFVFAADLIREINTGVVCHFVREDVRDVDDGGHERREVYFGSRPELKGRDVLLLDAVLESGVTQEFLLRRLGESQPRSLRLAVLLDKPARRRVGLEPDYFGFRTASKDVWVGFGLAADNGTGRNYRGLSCGPAQAKRRQGQTK
ncbi:MAG: phosphoribosyltransferase family protein [Candidatus Acidiferrum sp.]